MILLSLLCWKLTFIIVLIIVILSYCKSIGMHYLNFSLTSLSISYFSLFPFHISTPLSHHYLLLSFSPSYFYSSSLPLISFSFWSYIIWKSKLSLLTLLFILGEFAECHVISFTVWQWIKHEFMNIPIFCWKLFTALSIDPRKPAKHINFKSVTPYYRDNVAW